MKFQLSVRLMRGQWWVKRRRNQTGRNLRTFHVTSVHETIASTGLHSAAAVFAQIAPN